MKRILIGLALLGLAGSGSGQEMKMMKAEDLVWTEHPVFKGAQTVILVGDPTKAEMIVQRTKFPPHYRVPPHTHPYAEVVTVLSGNYWNSFGQSFDKSKGTELPPGVCSCFQLGTHIIRGRKMWRLLSNAVSLAQRQNVSNPNDDPRKKGGAQARQSPWHPTLAMRQMVTLLAIGCGCRNQARWSRTARYAVLPRFPELLDLQRQSAAAGARSLSGGSSEGGR